MQTIVIKRDGTKKPFDEIHIINAVFAAANSVGVTATLFPTKISNRVAARLHERKEVQISEIQSVVEEELMKSKFPEVARAYIEYRHDRDVEREKSSVLMQDIRGLADLSNTDVINENANKDGKRIPTQRDLLAGIVAKQIGRAHV